nr:MAG TPA: hypothetical protein [Caudoviricetes sp.]
MNTLAESDKRFTETRHVSLTIKSFFLNLTWLAIRVTSSIVKLSPITMA